MGLYSNVSFDLLCEQVNRDNPELEVPFSRDTVVLLQGPLTDNLGSSKRNTRAIFNGIQGSGINSKREVFFDRLDLAKLYGPTKVVASAPATATVIKDMLAPLNAQLGLALTVNDLATPDMSLGVGAVQGTFSLVMHAKSLAYTGSVSVSWTRAPVGIFPESGPGTKLMKFGSLEAGYFGIVPESAMFNKVGFYNAINDGTEANVGDMAPESGGFYFKFAYKNRFIFVPAYPLIDNINWLSIYNKSAMYPPMQAEHYLPEGTARVDQSGRIIPVVEGLKTWQLKPRIASASAVDPAQKVTYVESDRGGEWFDLFRHVTKLGPSSTGAWDDKPQLGEQNHYEWVLNTFITPISASGFVYTPKLQVGIDMLKTTAPARRWRPVFEVVNDLNLLQGVKFGGSLVTGRLPSIVLNVELPPITERLVGIQQFKGTVDAPAAGPVVNTSVEGIFPLKNVSWETDAKTGIGQVPPITVTKDNVLSQKGFSWTTYELPAVNNVTITR